VRSSTRRCRCSTHRPSSRSTSQLRLASSPTAAPGRRASSRRPTRCILLLPDARCDGLEYLHYLIRENSADRSAGGARAIVLPPMWDLCFASASDRFIASLAPSSRAFASTTGAMRTHSTASRYAPRFRLERRKRQLPRVSRLIPVQEDRSAVARATRSRALDIIGSGRESPARAACRAPTLDSRRRLRRRVPRALGPAGRSCSQAKTDFGIAPSEAMAAADPWSPTRRRCPRHRGSTGSLVVSFRRRRSTRWPTAGAFDPRVYRFAHDSRPCQRFDIASFPGGHRLRLEACLGRVRRCAVPAGSEHRYSSRRRPPFARIELGARRLLGVITCAGPSTPPSPSWLS
jgi:hypothetical protein